MSKQVKLTTRDIQVLEGCYRNTVMSFSQIHERYFKGLSIATVSNRLGQLVESGLLIKTRFALPLMVTGQSPVGVVYQLARFGLKALGELFPDEVIREKLIPLNNQSIRHDLVLNEALQALERRFPDSRVINERLWKNGYNHASKRNPDAIILQQDGKPSVAIELELTAKSKKTYRDIILQYRLNNLFSKVLYVVSGNVIRKKIEYQITNQKKIPGLSNPSTGKFYFVTLLDLLKDPLAATISNGESELSVTIANGPMARTGERT